MAFIDYIPYDDASPELKRLYEKSGAPKRTPANIIRVSGVNPKAYDAHLAFNRGIMGKGLTLEPQQQELIATVVSALNQCHY